MPQEIRVLCCFKCKMYQVDIVKKATKWQCKMCGVKQSVFKEFFRGPGAECRQKAQELNFEVNTKQITEENELLNLLERDDLDIDLDAIVKEERKALLKEKQCEFSTGKSKWAAFVEPGNQNRSEGLNVNQSNNLKRKICSNSEDLDIPKQIRPSSTGTSKWSHFL